MCERHTLVRQCPWENDHWDCKDHYNTLNLKDSHHLACALWVCCYLCLHSLEAGLQEHWRWVEVCGDLKDTNTNVYTAVSLLSEADNDSEIGRFETQALPSSSALVSTYVSHSFPMCGLLVHSLTHPAFYLPPSETPNMQEIIFHLSFDSSQGAPFNHVFTWSDFFPHKLAITPKMPLPVDCVSKNKGEGVVLAASPGPYHDTPSLTLVTFHLSSHFSLLCYFLWSPELSETQATDFYSISTSAIKLRILLPLWVAYTTS